MHVLVGERWNIRINADTQETVWLVYWFALFLSVSLSRIRKRPVLGGVRLKRKHFFLIWLILMFFSFGLHNVITWPMVLFVVRLVWLWYLIYFLSIFDCTVQTTIREPVCVCVVYLRPTAWYPILFCKSEWIWTGFTFIFKIFVH